MWAARADWTLAHERPRPCLRRRRRVRRRWHQRPGRRRHPDLVPDPRRHRAPARLGQRHQHRRAEPWLSRRGDRPEAGDPRPTGSGEATRLRSRRRWTPGLGPPRAHERRRLPQAHPPCSCSWPPCCWRPRTASARCCGSVSCPAMPRHLRRIRRGSPLPSWWCRSTAATSVPGSGSCCSRCSASCCTTGLDRLNALKQVMSFVINTTAALFFLTSGKVYWTIAAVMAVASLLGGSLGGRLAGKVKPTQLRGDRGDRRPRRRRRVRHPDLALGIFLLCRGWVGRAHAQGMTKGPHPPVPRRGRDGDRFPIPRPYRSFPRARRCRSLPRRPRAPRAQLDGAAVRSGDARRRRDHPLPRRPLWLPAPVGERRLPRAGVRDAPRPPNCWASCSRTAVTSRRRKRATPTGRGSRGTSPPCRSTPRTTPERR